MPGIDAVEPVSLPLWAALALLVLFVAVCLVAIRRWETGPSVTTLVGIPALVIIAWSTWSFVDHAAKRERTTERLALDARAAALATQALTPGLPLACLDANAGAVVENSCEKAIFASPESTAAAVSYVSAQLLLLADSLDFAAGAERSDTARWAGLRRALESDRYGIVAHVLATRDACTADRCAAFAMLRDSRAVKANLSSRAYEEKVNRYAAGWAAERQEVEATAAAAPSADTEAANAAVSAVPLLPTLPTLTKPIDFPSAASIPPVSIMNEPVAAAPTAEANPPRRPPAANGANTSR